MKYINQTRILFCLVIFLSSSLVACSSSAQQRPADFAVTDLEISPSQVVAGKQVTVTAKIINVGEMPGNFAEPLLVNGVEADTKVVTMMPNATKTLTYTISAGKPGDYLLKLGNTTARFNVPNMVEADTELKYDDGISRDALWANYNGGFLIEFTPASIPFQLTKVMICGGIYGTGWEGKTFELFVLDKDMKSIIYEQVYAIAKFPVKGAFPYQAPAWVDFDIPPAVINDKFYVYLYTSTGKHKGIHVGVDDSVLNEHSDLAQGKPPYITTVAPSTIYPVSIWYAERNNINWMIRVSGTSLVETR